MRPRTVNLRLRTLITGAVLSLVVGLGISGLVRSPTSRNESGAIDVTRAPADSRGHLESTRSSRSRTGATAAASTYVRLGQRIYNLGPDERITALRAMAARPSVDGYVATQTARLAELDGIAQRGTGPLTWSVSVLATRVEAFTRARARVAIWRVGVLSIEGLTAPLAEWTTVTYELVWEGNAWRIWSETQAPGPTPMGHPEETPSTPAQLRGALDGFVRYPDGEAL